MARGGTELSSWASSLLHRLGIHQSPGAIKALTGWARAEGGHFANDAKFNVLNTTQAMPGARNTGSQGDIKVYRSWDQGLAATVKTLKNGRYDGILQALAAGDANGVAHAIGASPWGTSGALVAKTIGAAPSVAGAHPLDGAAAPGPAPSGPTYLRDPSTETIRPDSTRQRVDLAMQVLKRKDLGVLDLARGVQAQDAQDAAATRTVAIPGIEAPQAPQAAPTRSGGGSGGGGSHKIVRFDGHDVVEWMVPALKYAREHGWPGQVISGVRSPELQAQLYADFKAGRRAGPVAKPHESNHDPANGGAVDVSHPDELASVLQDFKGQKPVQGLAIGDRPHFSRNGH